MSKTNKVILAGAVLVVAGFFFGWLGLSVGGQSYSVTGWEVARVARDYGAAYYLIYLLPAGAVIAGLVALKNRQAGAKIGMAVGGVFLLWAVAEVLRILWHTTFVGLWMTLAGAAVLFIGGLLTYKSRS